MDGSRFQDLSRDQERVTAQREEVERQRRLLGKRRPGGGVGGGGGGGGRSSPAVPGTGKGKDGFVKPPTVRCVFGEGVMCGGEGVIV